MSGAYELTGVVQRRAAKVVLEIDRLAIEAGEVLCLVGPTGAGKSSLLRILAGVEAPAAGTVLFDRAPLAPVQRRITLVFQRPLMLAGSVRRNVGYGLQLRGERQDERIEATLDRLGLRDVADRDARALSGGETQLVALARALVLEPDVILLDEPTASLDPARVRIVEEALAARRSERPMTIVWATHNLFQAKRCATRVALMLDGGIVETAPVGTFFEDPVDPRARAFVRGEMIF